MLLMQFTMIEGFVQLNDQCKKTISESDFISVCFSHKAIVWLQKTWNIYGVLCFFWSLIAKHPFVCNSMEKSSQDILHNFSFPFSSVKKRNGVNRTWIGHINLLAGGDRLSLIHNVQGLPGDLLLSQPIHLLM